MTLSILEDIWKESPDGFKAGVSFDQWLADLVFILRNAIEQTLEENRHLADGDSEMEALILEMNLIKEYRPRYNVNLRDDKSYPYIRVTHEMFPRIFPTRRIVKDGSQYFGPYTDVGQMKALLRAVKRIFPIRSCNYHFTPEIIARKKYKLCLDYYIKKCDGPCEGLVSAEDYGKVVQQVVNFINGRDRQVVKEMQDKMQTLAEKRLYEEAGKMRDRIRFIEEFQYRQKIVTEDLKDRDIVSVAMEDEDAAGAGLGVVLLYNVCIKDTR